MSEILSKPVLSPVEGAEGNEDIQPVPKKRLSFFGIIEFGAGGLILGLIAFTLLLFALNYFNVLSLSKANPKLFGLLPHQEVTTQTIIKDNRVVNIAARDLTKLVFPCPVKKEDCTTGESILYNTHPSFAYKTTTGSAALNLVRTTKKGYISFLNSQDKTERHIYQSFSLDNTCYVLTYIFPKDFSYGNIFTLPFDNGNPLGLLGKEYIKISDRDKSVVLQLQKFTGSPNCSLENKVAEDLGNDYLELTEDMFNRTD